MADGLRVGVFRGFGLHTAAVPGVETCDEPNSQLPRLYMGLLDEPLRSILTMYVFVIPTYLWIGI